MSVLHVTEGDHAWRLNDPGLHIGRIIAMSGQPYEVSVLRAMAQAYRPGTLVVDVGAHVGNHSLYMAEVCDALVLAFEAAQVNYDELVANVALNEGATERVAPVLAAVGAASGSATFGDAPLDDIRWGKAGATPSDSGEVQMLALDDVLPDYGDVSIVKVDVEGGEPDVIAGAQATLQRCRPTVFLEAQDDAAGARNTAAMRQVGVGYRLTAVLNRRRTPVQVWSAP